MASVLCKKCGEMIDLPEGSKKRFVTCPQCRSAVQVSLAPARAASQNRPTQPTPQYAPQAAPQQTPQYAPQAAPQPTPQYAPQATPQQAPQAARTNALPTVMKANKRVAGQPCNICGRPINLGEQIHNCPTCQSVNHDACWRQSNGCSSLSCRTASPPAPSMQSRSVAAPAGNTVPCRWCKEPIIRGAKKCKHCNEYQSDLDRERLSNNAVLADEESLTVTDWIGVLCCPIIGFIQGAVYSSQGRPKGKKLMLYSAISMGIGALIKAGGH